MKSFVFELCFIALVFVQVLTYAETPSVFIGNEGSLHTFDNQSYTKNEKKMQESEKSASFVELSQDRDSFSHIAKLQEDTRVYSTLKLMYESVPKTKKGFSYSYSFNGGVISETLNKDRVYYENGAWCFSATSRGFLDFIGTPRQDYSIPYTVCIPKPTFVTTVKISKDNITMISKGTIQLDCDSDQQGHAKAPAVNKFSTRDLELSGFNARGGDKNGFLSEGVKHTVIIPFMGVETTWTAIGTTKEWATPIYSEGRTSNGRWSTGDPFPPYRAERTITQSVDLNEIAKLKGWPLSLVYLNLVFTRMDGFIRKYQTADPRISGPNLMDYGDFPEIDLAAAVWQAAGFTTLEDEFEKIYPTVLPDNAHQISWNIKRMRYQSRIKALDYCAKTIESASSISELYDLLWQEIYPGAVDEDVAIQDPKSFFYSGLLFSSLDIYLADDSAEWTFRERVRYKLIALLEKDNSAMMDEFLASVKAYGETHDVSHLPTHPVLKIREALRQ